jgi:DNA repair protein RadC
MTTPSSNLPWVKSPTDVLALAADMREFEQEHLRVLILNTKNRLLRSHELYIGSLNACTVRVCELFREAVRSNGAAIVVIHNHPSGDPTPSRNDVELTREVNRAGKILDIELLDHMIVGTDGHVSLKEMQLGFDSRQERRS